MIYRAAHYLARGFKRNTCGKPECVSAKFAGENNPFWGSNHSEEVMQRIRDTKRARPQPSRKGIPTGRTNSAEHRAATSARLRRMWLENREKMMAGSRAVIAKWKGAPHRYRRVFSKPQRLAWLADKCTWCDSTEHLFLDHILPASCGGLNERSNAQTLCRACNLWKMIYIDRPLLLAGATYKGG